MMKGLCKCDKHAKVCSIINSVTMNGKLHDAGYLSLGTKQ